MTRRPRVDLGGPLTPAIFVDRPNRFVVRARLEEEGSGDPVEAHLADPGRLEKLLVPGARVWLRPAARPGRRTRWSAVLVESPEGGGLVSVDTTLPNRLVARALERGFLDELEGWRPEAAEWTPRPAAEHGGSRFDFLLARGTERLVLEVKSVTLVEDGLALFPDAVTARGTRHVRELKDLARRAGWHAAVLFVLQRADARRIRAAPAIDPDFAAALDEARAAGVAVLGRRCDVRHDSVVLGDAVPVD